MVLSIVLYAILLSDYNLITTLIWYYFAQATAFIGTGIILYIIHMWYFCADKAAFLLFNTRICVIKWCLYFGIIDICWL